MRFALALLAVVSVALARPGIEKGDTHREASDKSEIGNSPGLLRPCCRALTAQCMACAAGLSVEDYCNQNPGMP
jgi:hypothetical protein